MKNLLFRPIKNLIIKQTHYFSGRSAAKIVDLPILTRKPDDILIKQWWSQSAFPKNEPLNVPVFNFESGEFIGQSIELDQEIFNIPLRRDVIHTAYQWYLFKDKKLTHITRTKGTTAGSGKKMQAQKGTGRARVGNKRAPGRKKGGKAHGPQPRDMSYTIPQKKKLLALRSLLSARLAEGHLRIVDQENLDQPKTRILSKDVIQQKYLKFLKFLQLVKQFGEKQRVLLITSYKQDENFQRASRNIQQLKVQMPHKIDIFDLLKFQKLIITKEGLLQLTQEIKDQMFLSSRPRGLYTLKSVQQRQEVWPLEVEEKPVYDPTKPLNFKFQILQDYLSQYESNKNNQQKNDQST